MRKFITLLLVLSSFYSLIGQTTTSSIKGLVKSSNNETLPGATVQAIHTPTGSKYSALSNEDGRFSMLNMRIGGPYKIVVTFVGYQSEVFNDVYLDLGKVFSLDVFLKDESQKLDEVKVTGAKNKVFSSGRTGAETTVGRRELTTLPSISRSASDFTRLEPSASGGSFGGRNDKFNNFSLNGAVFNNPFGLDAATPGGQTGAQPISLDAIEQIQVATAPYDVTLSGFTGASVNAVTKSGTNEFHGTAYGFFRNQDMTGNKIKGEKIFVPSLEQNQAGFSIGGPIVKNKLFFFTNFEIDKRSDSGSNVVANDGNSTIGVNESRVLATDLMYVSTELGKLGYNSGSYQGFTHYSNSNKGIVKLDWNINDDHKLAVIYNFLDASKDKPAHPTAIRRRGPDNNTMQFENSGYQINNQISSFLVELNSKFTETISNKLQVGYTHFNDFRNPFSAPAPVISITKDGSPYIIAGHEPFSINNRLDQKVLQITDNMNIVRGNHTFTAGFSFEKFIFKNSFNLKGYGFDVFGSVDMAGFTTNINNGYYATAFANAQTTFDAKNKLEAGTDGGWNLSETTVGQLAFYVQDEWNINDDFKLIYGLRADKPLYFNTAENIQKFIDTDNSEGYLPGINYYDPKDGSTVNLNSTVLPGNALLWSPRVGFNWDINGEKTTQLRGGTGIFTGRLPFVWIGNQVSGIDPFFYQVVDTDFK
ncbi:MAG: TonB-dependent receptor, partial [Methylotenera sp.]|nr:TonB-dependent receptor [Flavobacterium sp.]